MNELFLPNNRMPVVVDTNHYMNSRSFIHPDRCLDFHVLLYIRSGIFYVTEDETDYEISSGNAIFFKSGIRHCGKRTIPPECDWYFVHFRLPQEEEDRKLPDFVPSLEPLPHNTPLAFRRSLPKMLKGIADTKLEQAIMELPALFHSEDPMRAWELNLRCFQLLSAIAESVSPTPEETLSDRICRYLAVHKYEKFSAPALEQAFFLSYKHLAAVFKKEKGLTMQQYHTGLRMRQAGNLLTSTLMPVSDISAQLGFSDVLYFSRCFHRFFGESPTQYRQTHYRAV